MAQVSSDSGTVREPSMEEILLSIRRIIEDSQVLRQDTPLSGAAPMNMTSASDEVTKEPRETLLGVRPTISEKNPDDLRTLAEGVSRDAAEAMNALAARIGLRGPVMSAENILLVNEAQKNRIEDHEPVSNMNNDRLLSSTTENAAVLRDIEPENALASNLERDTVLKAAPSAAMSSDSGVFDDHSNTMDIPLTSTETKRQVAALFDELWLILTAKQRQSFCMMTEDMMRSMLQNWLDNHLPGLVERLVREEIERMVRAIHPQGGE